MPSLDATHVRLHKSSLTDKILNGHPDVLRNLAQKEWGYVPARMEWNRRASAICVPILLVRSTLPHFRETKPLENLRNFARLENRYAPHSR